MNQKQKMNQTHLFDSEFYIKDLKEFLLKSEPKKKITHEMIYINQFINLKQKQNEKL